MCENIYESSTLKPLLTYNALTRVSSALIVRGVITIEVTVENRNVSSLKSSTLERNASVSATLAVSRYLQMSMKQQRSHKTCSERDVRGMALSPTLIDLHDLQPNAGTIYKVTHELLAKNLEKIEVMRIIKIAKTAAV